MAERTRPRVLVHVAEPAAATTIARAFVRSGFDVSHGCWPVEVDASQEADLVVLEVTLPRPGTVDLRRLRDTCDVPILVVGPNAADDDRATVLDLGADDFVTAPVSPDELVARARAILRRTSRGSVGAEEASTVLQAGPVRIDLRRRRAEVADREVALTRMEFKLLRFFVTHAGRALTRDELFEQVWGYSIGDRATVTVHVRRLREKIEPDPSRPQLVRTVWGVGYCFAPDG